MDRKTLNKCSQTPQWGSNYLPFRFFFGKGWTIATINHGKIGREIHVQSSVPLRKISIEIMDSFDCDWFTAIDPSNKRAINLALKTGFEFVRKITTSDLSTGELEESNLYKRPLKWEK